MRVLAVASEVAPWCKTGGLADVTGALPAALRPHGVEIATVCPLYRAVKEHAKKKNIELTDTGVNVQVDFARERIWGRFLSGGDGTFFLECDRFYERDGIYNDKEGRAWSDNAFRYGFLCKAALEAAPALLGGPPDVVHAHDWQGALALVYLQTHYGGKAGGVFTIHNLAYQGVCPKETLPLLGLDWGLFNPEALEFHDHINLLKGGIAAANITTTVSPRYADEIRTPTFGQGLDGFLRNRRVVGILNGIDTEEWNPAKDPHLPVPYSLDELGGKLEARKALLELTGLTPEVGEPVLAVVSRFTGQKGLDLVADVASDLHSIGARLVVLGTGDTELEGRFTYLSRALSRHVATKIGFDVALAHKIIAGADAFLMPSRFEPCGLNQMYAMAYGTVPIVRNTGGLHDTVRDPGDAALCAGHGTGFAFDHDGVEGLRWAIRRAAGIYRWVPEGWGNIMRAGMSRDWSWAASARNYMTVYRQSQR